MIFSKMTVLDYSREREELRLRCQEKKLQRQAEVIRGALNELGCEELPSGCDLSMEGSFAEPPPTQKVNRTMEIIIKSPQKSVIFVVSGLFIKIRFEDDIDYYREI